MSPTKSKRTKEIIDLDEKEIEVFAQEMIERGLFPVWHPAPPPKRKSMDSIIIKEI